MPPVTYDRAAFDAVRQNNAVKCGPEAVSFPYPGGNVETLQRLVGGPVPAEEFTLPRFELSSGADFVAVQLIMDYRTEGAMTGRSPILNPEVTRVGISNRANRFSVNLIQTLYVKLPLPPPLTPE